MIQKTKFKETDIGLIPEEWEETTVGIKCKIKNGKTNTQDAVNGGKYPLYDRSTQIKRSNKFLFDTEAVIIPGEGKEFIPKYHKGKFDLHQRAYAIWSENDDINIKYVYYWIERNKIYLSNIAVGSTVKSLRLNHLENFPLCLPQDIREENQIAKILSDLDSKIELLQKQNETLEKIGQAIFKHWFVDFEFPNEEGKPYKLSGGKMVESELGEIPEGWSVGKLGDIAKQNKKSINPSQNEETFFDYYSFSSYDNCKYPELVKGKDILSNKFVAKPNCVLFSKLNLNYPKIWFLGKDIGDKAISSTEFIHVMPNNIKTIEFIYYFLIRKSTISRIKAFARGTSSSHQRISPKDLFTLLVPINEEVIQKFSKYTNSILVKHNKNITTIQSLQKTRDLLLPRLMTGKIRVPLETKNG
jgi:type I restriction enzyme S subunit